MGISTRAHFRDGSRNKTLQELRFNLLERTYGPRLTWTPRTAQELDDRISLAVRTAKGEYGYLLSVALHALRNGNEDRNELFRLQGLKQRRPADEAKRARSARQWLEIARCAQSLHEVEFALTA